MLTDLARRSLVDPQVLLLGGTVPITSTPAAALSDLGGSGISNAVSTTSSAGAGGLLLYRDRREVILWFRIICFTPLDASCHALFIQPTPRLASTKKEGFASGGTGGGEALAAAGAIAQGAGIGDVAESAPARGAAVVADICKDING